MNLSYYVYSPHVGNSTVHSSRAAMQDNSGPIVQRLEIIQNMIQLGETDVLVEQAERLDNISTPGNDALQKIADALFQEQYSEATSLIDSYLHSEASIQGYTDPHLSALQLEAEALKKRLTELEVEKAEIEREIREFNLRHEQELGPILEEILEIQVEEKREKAKNQTGNEKAEAEYQQAREEYENYSQAVEEAQAEERNALSEAEEKELKKCYRKASKNCHPDAVEEAREEEAQEVFVELQEAYERNDLDAVRRIADRVEGGAFGSRGKKINEVDKLEEEVKRLRQRIEALDHELEMLRTSDLYQKISDIDDLDHYFEVQKKCLRDELRRLRNERSDSV